jgi:ribosomal protein S18 acetylase RimI-like enzyme
MQIRHARPGDEAELAHLLDDHERHFGGRASTSAATAGAAFLVAPPAGGTLCLVAEQEGRLVGFAILNPYFPAAGLSHGLLLKELYVAAQTRSTGIGEQLIASVRDIAKQRGYTRVIWTTGADNVGAQRLYDRLGMRREKKVYYVMDGWA